MISFFRSNQVGIRTSPSFPSFRSTFSLPYSFSEIFFRYFWKICIITFWIIHGLILEKFAHANMLKFDEANFAFTLTLILKQVELGNKVFPQVFVHTIVCRGYVKRVLFQFLFTCTGFGVLPPDRLCQNQCQYLVPIAWDIGTRNFHNALLN